jgi:hypothetical protein
MKKLMHILKGWGKALGFIPISAAEGKLSEMRLNICRVCDYAKSKRVFHFINDEAVVGYDLFCTKCKCPCVEKSLVVDEICPINKW